jgi:hypothetical protein
VVSLGSEDHVVVRAHLQAAFCPCVEMRAGGDVAADSFHGADGPELVEGGSALDGRLVHAAVLVDIVGAPVACYGSLVRAALRRVVVAVALDNVVLDEGAGRPAIDREVRVACRGPGAVVDDRPCHVGQHYWKGLPKIDDETITQVLLGASGVPSLAGDEVATAAAPSDGIRATRPVVVVHAATTITPEGVVEAVVGAGAGRSVLALEPKTLEKVWERLARRGKGCADGRDAEEEGRKGDHGNGSDG